MPKPKRVPVTHPDFPHGTNTGYSAGCRKANEYPCPASPTCHAKHAEHHARYMKKRRRSKVKEGRVTSLVRKRLRQTLATVSIEEVAEFTGLRASQIENFLRCDLGPRTNSPTAAELDRAWAWFVRGSDLRTITEHGSDTYYKAWCRCPTCASDQSRVKKRWEAGYRVKQDVWDPDLAAHTRLLVDAAGSIGQLTRVLDLHYDAIKRILADPTRPVRIRTRDRLRAWSPARVRHARTSNMLLDPEPTRLRVGQLNALGYPNWWINREAGVQANHSYPEGRMVMARIERAIRELHARVGDEWADPSRHGIDPGTITRTKNRARKMGYYQPAAYDDDGVVDFRAIPGHPWANLDERADTAVQTVYLLAGGMTQREVRKHTGVSDNLAGRMSKSVGLVYFTGSGELDYRASRDAIRKVVATHSQYEAGQIGPVTAALMLNLIDAETRRKDHPEVTAWLEAATGEGVAA